MTTSLLRIKVLSDNGYTTIFHPHEQGATVYAPDSFELNVQGKPLLQGYRDETGLWCIPLVAPKQSEHEHTLINDK